MNQLTIVHVEQYVIFVPQIFTYDLGVANDFELTVQINNFLLNSQALSSFSYGDRTTEGQAHLGGMYSKFSRSSLRLKNGSMTLIVPAVNGELQVRGIYNALYHELNHIETSRQVKVKHQYLPDSELNDLSVISANRRTKSGERLTRFAVQDSMRQDNRYEGFLTQLEYGRYYEAFRTANFLFYALWEQTERNARVEGLYGDLKYFKATRENINEILPQTELYRDISSFKKYLEEIEEVPTNDVNGIRFWAYVSNIISMNMLSTREKPGSNKNFFEQVKKRFVNRSRELIDEMYRKGMRIVELYFERQGARDKAGRAPSIHDKINTRAQAKTGKL